MAIGALKIKWNILYSEVKPNIIFGNHGLNIEVKFCSSEILHEAFQDDWEHIKKEWQAEELYEKPAEKPD